MASVTTLARAWSARLLSGQPAQWVRDAMGGSARHVRRGSAHDRHFWQQFADRFQLSYELDATGMPRIDGAIEGVVFKVRPDGAAHGDHTAMVMTASAKPTLSVGSPLHGISGWRRTGDEGFDRGCRATGPSEVVVACLDERARRQVTALIAAGGRIDRGQAELTMPGRADADEARAAANLVFHAAFAIDHAPADRLERLLRIAGESPHPAVGARALGAAAALAAAHPEVVRRLDAAKRSPTNPYFDLLGRLSAGQIDSAAELVAAAEDPSLVALASELAEAGDLGRVLIAASASRSADVARVIAEGALRTDAATRISILETLGGVSQRPGPSDDDAEAMRALAHSCRDEPGEAFDRTFAMLTAHRWPSVADEALRALARHGTVRAVPILRAQQARVPRSVADRIRSVIASIQAKVGPVEAGRLSLAPGDARGRVSLAQSEPSSEAATDEDG